ncbi:DUF6507 family protein [Arthrobacter sp. NPDC058097]|uniref:DUF6507 family protein n=1 Tax=Arthrobacter sp. NPDC058097 TaxID=3346340 RepID=UPI0036D9DB6D
MAGTWNIDVPAARGVISSTAASVSDLQRPLEQMRSAVEGLAAAVPSAVVQQALGSLLEMTLSPAVKDVVDRSTTVVSGTSGAVGHYVNGDLVMASTAASSAASIHTK